MGRVSLSQLLFQIVNLFQVEDGRYSMVLEVLGNLHGEHDFGLDRLSALVIFRRLRQKELKFCNIPRRFLEQIAGLNFTIGNGCDYESREVEFGRVG